MSVAGVSQLHRHTQRVKPRKSTMCKWTRPDWGTDCRRAPKSLSSAQAAPLCSAGIERPRKCLRGQHFLRCCHSTHGLLFRGSAAVTRGGRQRFVTQTLRVHLLGLEKTPHLLGLEKTPSRNRGCSSHTLVCCASTLTLRCSLLWVLSWCSPGRFRSGTEK